MNKLKYLLDEFYQSHGLECTYRDDLIDHPDILLSKKHGFVKWLCDSGKIDRAKVDELQLIPTLTYQNMMDDCDCGKSHWHPYTFVSDENELLMLLVIDENPISLLISLLK